MSEEVFGAIPVERGCGTREAGAVYAECGMGPGGRPVESFLCDPPQPIDVEAMGIIPRGVTLFQHEGVWHIADWVGSQNYTNVADFVEEWRRFGSSRKLPSSLDFSRLTVDSKIMLLHSCAIVENWKDYSGDWDDCTGRGYEPCPNGAHDFYEPCAGIWWQDVEGTERIGDTDHPRRVLVRMPSFSYMAAERPEGVEPVYKVGAFAVMPITRLVVVKDDDGGKHEKNMQKAGKSSLPVALVEE